jgi:hypothetical protein
MSEPPTRIEQQATAGAARLSPVHFSVMLFPTSTTSQVARRRLSLDESYTRRIEPEQVQMYFIGQRLVSPQSGSHHITSHITYHITENFDASAELHSPGKVYEPQGYNE